MTKKRKRYDGGYPYAGSGGQPWYWFTTGGPLGITTPFASASPAVPTIQPIPTGTSLPPSASVKPLDIGLSASDIADYMGRESLSITPTAVTSIRENLFTGLDDNYKITEVFRQGTDTVGKTGFITPSMPKLTHLTKEVTIEPAKIKTKISSTTSGICELISAI